MINTMHKIVLFLAGCSITLADSQCKHAKNLYSSSSCCPSEGGDGTTALDTTSLQTFGEILSKTNIETILDSSDVALSRASKPFRFVVTGCNYGVSYGEKLDPELYPGFSDTSVGQFSSDPNLIGFFPQRRSAAARDFFNFAMAGQNPDVLILAGDNTYNELLWNEHLSKWTFHENGVNIMNTNISVFRAIQHDDIQKTLKAAYDTPSFVKAVTRDSDIKLLMTMDDHDHGINDVMSDKIVPMFREAVFDYWFNASGTSLNSRPFPLPTLPNPNGSYYSFMSTHETRKIQSIVLDSHTFASLPTNGRKTGGPNETLLGTDQWEWLEKQLLMEADLRIISPGPMVFFHSEVFSRYNSFQFFPFELQRLGNLIRKTKANGIVFVTSDSHVGSVTRSADDFPYRVYNIHTPSQTHSWMPWYAKGLYGGTFGDPLSYPEYPVVADKVGETSLTGFSQIDLYDDAENPYVVLKHNRVYGMATHFQAEADMSQWRVQTEGNFEIIIPLSDMQVPSDVPTGFDWKTDYTTFPICDSTKNVQCTNDWVADNENGNTMSNISVATGNRANQNEYVIV